MKYFSIAIIIMACFTFCLAGFKLQQAFSHPVRYQDEIKQFSQVYNLDCVVVASLINVESSYNSDAKSNKNAIGLMQIKLETANYLDKINNRENVTEAELFNAKTNIKYGCEYLSYLINKFGDVYTSLSAYNAGETKVRSWLSNPEYSTDKKTLINIPFPETKNYIKKIKNNIKFYKKVY